MDASYKIQRGIHVHLIQFFMCPEFWVHITEGLRFLSQRGRGSMAERNAKLILMVGVLGVSASAILVRFSQAPSGVTAAYRLGWTVLLLLPVVLLRCRA